MGQSKIILCGCGCGENAPAYFYHGMNKGRLKYIPSHRPTRSEQWTKESIRKMVAKQRINTLKRNPIGSRRKHRAGKNLFYWVIKNSPIGKWKYEHRVVMEKIIGRSLLKKEHVHHINHNSLDNRPENLELLTHSQHSTEHGKDRFKKGLLIKLRRPPIPNGKWTIKFDACIECHSTAVAHASHGRCKNCHGRFLRHLISGGEYSEK